MTMWRAALVALATLIAGSARADERAVTLGSNPAPLSGTLLLPESGGRVPGVVILGGSGPTDRDGNTPGFHNDALRLLAQGLAGCGIASLRADKRGIALSAAAGPDEEDLTLGGNVADTVAWLGFLRAQPRIASVGLVGHSEGALIASMAAEKTPVRSLVLIAGSGQPLGALIRAQLDGIGMAPILRRKAEATLESLERGETVEFPSAGLAALFRPSVQPYLVSELKVDPVAELARTAIPALVIQGTTDLQISVADANRLAASRRGVTEAVFPGMNHVLREAPQERQANLQTYEDGERPLMPGLVRRMCLFLRP